MRVAETYECKWKPSNVLVKPRHTVTPTHTLWTKPSPMVKMKVRGPGSSRNHSKSVDPWEDSIVKSRGITLPTKTCLVKAMVFPVVVYECESWTIKKAECWRIDAFQLWCWRRLESPLDCKIKPVNSKGNQCWIFIARTDVEAENSNTLATWCKELMHWKRPWCWERLKAGGEVDDRGWDGWMTSPTRWAQVWVNSGSWTGKPSVLQSMGSQRVARGWSTELNWEFSPLFHSLSCVVGRETLTIQSSSNPASCRVVRSSLWALSFSPLSSKTWKERQRL